MVFTAKDDYYGGEVCLDTLRFVPMSDYRPVATGRTRVRLESFRIGPTPREVLEMLDGERTLRDWINQYSDPDELLTFLRSLYLLVETDLAELD